MNTTITESISDEELRVILYKAEASPSGLVLWTNDFQLARNRLYRVRKEAGDESLASLQIRDGAVLGEGLFVIARGET